MYETRSAQAGKKYLVQNGLRQLTERERDRTRERETENILIILKSISLIYHVEYIKINYLEYRYISKHWFSIELLHVQHCVNMRMTPRGKTWAFRLLLSYMLCILYSLIHMSSPISFSHSQSMMHCIYIYDDSFIRRLSGLIKRYWFSTARRHQEWYICIL